MILAIDIGGSKFTMAGVGGAGMGCRASRGTAGGRRGAVRSGPGILASLLYDAFHGDRRGNLRRRQGMARRGFLWRRDRTPDHTPGRTRVPVRGARMLRASVRRAVAGARSWQAGE